MPSSGSCIPCLLALQIHHNYKQAQNTSTVNRKYKLLYIFLNRPRSIYQYSNMAPRLLGQNRK